MYEYKIEAWHSDPILPSPSLQPHLLRALSLVSRHSRSSVSQISLRALLCREHLFCPPPSATFSSLWTQLKYNLSRVVSLKPNQVAFLSPIVLLVSHLQHGFSHAYPSPLRENQSLSLYIYFFGRGGGRAACRILVP